MNVLGFDTTTDACSVALWIGDGVAAHRFETLRRGHVERLIPMIMEVMAEAHAGFGDMDLIAVTIGPGTFTGVRIGLAAARGLALATNLPVAGLTSLEVLAAGADDGGCDGRGVIAAIDARRGQLYRQTFGADLEPQEPPCVVERAAIMAPVGQWRIVGSGADAYAGLPGVLIDPVSNLPDAADLVRRAAARHGSGGVPLPASLPTPLYLREPDADLPKPAR